MDSSHLQFVQNRDHFMPELSLENQIRTPTATTASTRMRSLADDNVDQLDIVADKINDLSVSQGINSVAVTSEQEHLQLEQLIAQLTQQVSELTTFVKRSRSPAHNSNHFLNRNNLRNRFKMYQEPINGYCFTIQVLATRQKSVLLHALFVRKTRMAIVA
ncbi:hypothetical protein TNCV_159101 [Trichonephila clavipes]|uniref:Uncharacterized protein n=1 Tax=Trichonephila clavipes TaxID=2585209 RepID=A0A8X6UZZ8_TRICX|nr:hypothetical protein TNCV_159101 [Trichonephila clavipes]